MNKKLRKIANLETANLISPEIEHKINKILSVKRTSQWYLLSLNEQDCAEIQTALSLIQTKIQTNRKTISRVEQTRHEPIAIILDGEDFI